MIGFILGAPMVRDYLRTSELARAAGVHPNTVRVYVEWGLMPPVARNAAGYRLFTQHHLDCLRLSRAIYAAEYPGRELRASARDVIEAAVAGDWATARARAVAHLGAVDRELREAETAGDLLEHWAQHQIAAAGGCARSLGDVAKLLGVSRDVIRNWERDGLIAPCRSARNNYRVFREPEIERLRIIRMLSRAGYSHMAMLRMFLALDEGQTEGLKGLLDTPRPDEDIFVAADHWLTTLRRQRQTSLHVIDLIDGILRR